MPVNRKELSLAMPKAVGDAVGGNVLVGGESAQQWIRDMKPGEVERLGNLIADGIRSGETVAAVLKKLGINLLDHMRIKKVHPLYNSILTEASAEFAAMMLEEHALEVAAGKKVGERKVEQMAYDAQGNMIRKETTVERDLLTNVGAVKNLADRYRSIGRKESEKIREHGVRKPLTEEERARIIEAEFMSSDEQDMAEIERSNQEFDAACKEAEKASKF